jgi:O-antigen ligase
MSILQLYVLPHLFLRSISNGIDRLYGTQLSLALSLIAIAMVALSAPYTLRRMHLDWRIFPVLGALFAFIAISAISFAINWFVTGSVVDSYAGWYAIVRYLYIAAMITLFACVQRSPEFLVQIHRLFLTMLCLNIFVAIAQWLSGATVLVTQYDKYARVAGLSSHPVTFSMEVTLILCMCELARRKLQLPLRFVHSAIYTLAVITLILAASRTGLTLLAFVLGAYFIARKPLIFPLLVVVASAIIVISPFQELFYDLRSIPDYIASGDFTVWDYRTAVTSVHWRIHHWYYLSEMALEHPWFGFGPGQEKFYSPFSLEAHNQFVEVFFETGLAGVVSFGFFWLSLARFAMACRVVSLPPLSRSTEYDVRAFWLATFSGVTLVALLDQSLNEETVGLSYLILSAFVVRARPKGAEKSGFVSVLQDGRTVIAPRRIRISPALS